MIFKMMSFLKRAILSVVEKNLTGRKYLSLYRFKDHLEKMGWFRSIETNLPVDNEGNPLPWYTYPAISFLEKKIEPQMKIFEYGTGNSTLWWGKRVASVISIEHDLEWYESMKKRVPSNIEYKYSELVDDGAYCRIISKYEKKFDIVVIDGRDRVNCAKNTLKALRDNGIIIWDNSDRVAYNDGYQYLLDNGFKRLDFFGLGPINNISWCTSIFYRKNNCLEI